MKLRQYWAVCFALAGWLWGVNAAAAPLDLAALGFELETPPIAEESATASLFGGVLFSADTTMGAMTLTVAATGTTPFSASDFNLSAFPVMGMGELMGTGVAVGSSTDTIELLFQVNASSGFFADVSAYVFVVLTGDFGADPLGLMGDPATLGIFVPGTLTLSNVTATIPLPGTVGWLLAAAGVGWASRRSVRPLNQANAVASIGRQQPYQKIS